MKIRRLFGAVLTVPVMISGLLLVTAGPAAACSCAVASEPEHAANADAIFVGTLVDRVDPPQDGMWSSADPAVLTFDVSAVYKGTVRARQQVVTPMSGASCGLELNGTGPFLVFGREAADGMMTPEPGQLVSYLCGGSRAIAGGGEPQLGAFSAPQPPGAQPPGGQPHGAQPPGPAPSPGDTGASLPVAGLALGGVVLVAAAGAAVLAIRTRRRRLLAG